MSLLVKSIDPGISCISNRVFLMENGSVVIPPEVCGSSYSLATYSPNTPLFVANRLLTADSDFNVKRRLSRLLMRLNNADRSQFSDILREGLESLFAVVEVEPGDVLVSFSVHERLMRREQLQRLVPGFMDSLLDLARAKRTIADDAYRFALSPDAGSSLESPSIKVGDLITTFKEHCARLMDLDAIVLKDLPVLELGKADVEDPYSGLEVVEGSGLDGTDDNVVTYRARLDLKLYADEEGAVGRSDFLERWFAKDQLPVRWSVVESYLSGVYQPGFVFPTIKELKQAFEALKNKAVSPAEIRKKEELLECLELALVKKNRDWFLRELLLLNPNLSLSSYEALTDEELEGFYILYATLPRYLNLEIEDTARRLGKAGVLGETLSRFKCLHARGVEMYQRAFLGEGENDFYFQTSSDRKALLAELDAALTLSHSVKSVRFSRKSRIDRSRMTPAEESLLYDELWPDLPYRWRMGHLPGTSAPDLSVQSESGHYIVEVKNFLSRVALESNEVLAKVREQILRMALLARQTGHPKLVLLAYVDNTDCREARSFAASVGRCLELTGLGHCLALVSRDQKTRPFIQGDSVSKNWLESVFRKDSVVCSDPDEVRSLPIPRREVLRIRQMLQDETAKSRGLESLDRDVVQLINKWLPKVNLRRDINRRHSRKAIYRACRHSDRAVLHAAIEKECQMLQLTPERVQAVQGHLVSMKRDFGNDWSTVYIDHMWAIAEIFLSKGELVARQEEDNRLAFLLKGHMKDILEFLYNWESTLDEALSDFERLGADVARLALEEVQIESPLEVTASPRHEGYKVQELMDYLSVHPEQRESQLAQELYRSLEYLTAVYGLISRRLERAV